MSSLHHRLRAKGQGGSGFGYVGVGDNAATSKSVSVTPHASSSSPDLLLALLGTGGSTANAWNTATGFTEVVDQGAAPNIGVQHRNYSGAGAHTFSGSSTLYRSGQILTFRNAQVGVVGTIAARSGSTIVMPSVTMPDDGILIAFAAAENYNALGSTITGMTLVKATGFSGGIISFSQEVSAGATGTRTITASFSSAAGLLIGIIPS